MRKLAILSSALLFVMIPSLIQLSAQSLPEVAVCAPNGSGNAEEQLEVYDIDTTEGWARVRCLNTPDPGNDDGNGFCADWTQCTETKGDGLTYLTFLVVGEEIGGTLRYNADGIDSLIMVHGGGGGTAWMEDPRDEGAGDDTDWQDIQDNYGARVVGVRWIDVGIEYGGIAQGRFIRNDNNPDTVMGMGTRVAGLVQWMQDNLNPATDLLLIGSSAGADASLQAVLHDIPAVNNIIYLGLVSMAPFYDMVNICNHQEPAFIDPATGDRSENGVGAGIVELGPREFFDDLTITTKCSSQSMDQATAAGNSIEDGLNELVAQGLQFSGTIHAYPADGPPNTPDSEQGITWTLGNVLHHTYFENATRVWDYCLDQGHGSQLRDTDRPCFDRIYAEITALLDPVVPPEPECNDGIDNDGDGLIDLADPGCSDASDDDESDDPPLAECEDGIDNDGDGDIDLDDDGCTDSSDDDESDDPIPTGACCREDRGVCRDDYTEEDCSGELFPLTWYEDQTCAEITCPSE